MTSDCHVTHHSRSDGQAWRPILLDALQAGIAACPLIIKRSAEAPPDARCFAAISAFCVLGGHTWCVCPGARVLVLSGDEGSGDDGRGASSSAGVVLSGGCGAAEYSVVLDGAVRGWRTPLLVPAERVLARGYVALMTSDDL